MRAARCRYGKFGVVKRLQRRFGQETPLAIARTPTPSQHDNLRGDHN